MMAIYKHTTLSGAHTHQMYPLTTTIPNTGLAGVADWNYTSSGSVKTYRKRLSKFEIGLLGIAGSSKSITVIEIPEISESYYFKSVDHEVVIKYLGHLNPVLQGRPRKWATGIIQAASAPFVPVSGKAKTHANMLLSAGIFYAIPPVRNYHRTGYRLSSTGIVLLDHWAEKFPKFAPFRDAYLTGKSRNRINSDCVSFMLDHVPDYIVQRIKKDKEVKAAIDAGTIKPRVSFDEYRKFMRQQAELERQKMMMAPQWGMAGTGIAPLGGLSQITSNTGTAQALGAYQTVGGNGGTASSSYTSILGAAVQSIFGGKK